MAGMPEPVYTHGHRESVLKSHRSRTVENSAAYLAPLLNPTDVLLDVGAGPGTITVDLARRVSRVVATEIGVAEVALGRATAASVGMTNVEFQVADVHALPFADATFDVAHAHQVLQHVADPVQALREMARVTEPGGIVAVRDSDYTAFTWWPADQRLDRWLGVYRQAARANGGDPDAGRKLLAWAHAAGLSDVTATSSTWTYATPEARAWWGGMWAETGTGTGLELPSPIAWDNFSRAWEMVGFGTSLLVTALITVFSVAGAILVCSMFAYAVARNWNRRLYKITYIYVLTGLFVPFTVLILPLIKLTAALGIDSPVGVTLIHIVGGIAFNSLLYIAFLRSIPVELEEAAHIDGATTWQVFWRVIFPLLGPMNATVGIFAFLGAWNDFLLPQMMIADPTLQTLPVVQQLFQGEFNTEYNLAFASYLMAMVPTLIAFVFAQKWVMSGVMRGAIK